MCAGHNARPCSEGALCGFLPVATPSFTGSVGLQGASQVERVKRGRERERERERERNGKGERQRKREREKSKM